MYTDPGFKTKKELKDAVASGKEVSVFSPGFYPTPENGQAFIEGPSFKPHRWYAKVEVKDGLITKVS